MLSGEQLRIVAYWPNYEGNWAGTTLCRNCGEEADLPSSDAVSQYAASEFADGSELGHDLKPNGERCYGTSPLYCDKCSTEIIEGCMDEECPDCREEAGLPPLEKETR